MVTKEEVFKNLKAKLGNTQKLSDRSINELLESLIGSAAETDEDVAFTDRIYPIFDTFNRNLIKDNSDTIQQYIAQNPQPKKEEPTKTTPTTTPQGSDTQDLSDIKKTLSELTIKLEQQERQKTLETKRTQLKEALVKTHKIDEKWSGEYVSMFPITETDDVSVLSQRALEFYNLSIANVTSDGSPKTAGGEKRTINAAEEFADIKELQKTN